MMNHSVMALLLLSLLLWGTTLSGRTAQPPREEAGRVGFRVVEMPDVAAEVAKKTTELTEFLSDWPVGKELKDCETCPLLKVLEGGDGAASRLAVSEKKVTVGQWNACLSDKVCTGMPLKAAADSPAYVTARQELKFLSWLSHKTGKRYHLMGNGEYRARTSKSPLLMVPGFKPKAHPMYPMYPMWTVPESWKGPKTESLSRELFEKWSTRHVGPSDPWGCGFSEGTERLICVLRSLVQELERDRGFRVARWIDPDTDVSETKAPSGNSK